MATTKPFVGGQRISWGVLSSPFVKNYGVITSYESTDNISLHPETNANGTICKQVVYDSQTTVTATVLTNPKVEPPGVGTKIEAKGLGNMYVRSVSRQEQNKDYCKLRITMEKSFGCGEVTDYTGDFKGMMKPGGV